MGCLDFIFKFIGFAFVLFIALGFHFYFVSTGNLAGYFIARAIIGIYIIIKLYKYIKERESRNSQ